MSKTKVNIEKMNEELSKKSDNELARLIKARINNVKIRQRGSGAMPPEKDLNQLERGTYKQNLQVTGYEILTRSPTIIFYKSITDNTVIIAVRGSADTRDWLQTNTLLPFGGLTGTARYKEDKKFVGDNIGKYSNGNDIYVVGHSLGGVIADQLRRDFPIIKGGFTFNPAFQPQDYFRESKVDRKYTSRDPLGLLGRFLPGAKVENKETFLQRLMPTSILGRKDAHMLNAFESGKTGGNFTGQSLSNLYYIMKALGGKKVGGLVEQNDNVLVDMTDQQINDLGSNWKERSFMKWLKDQLQININRNIPRNIDYQNFMNWFNQLDPSLQSDLVWLNSGGIFKPSKGGKKVCMDKKDYVKEHKKLIRLLDKAGKEGQAQRKELEGELKGGLKGGIEIHGLNNFKSQYNYHSKQRNPDPAYVKAINKYIDTYLDERLKPEYPRITHKPTFKQYQQAPTQAPAPKPVKEPYVQRPYSTDLFEAVEKIRGMVSGVPRTILHDKPKKYEYPDISGAVTNPILSRLGLQEPKPVMTTGEYYPVNQIATDAEARRNEGLKRDIAPYKDYQAPVSAEAKGKPEKDDGYRLHAIIIKKNGTTKNDAVLEAVKFKTSKGLFMRETKLTYRFRNIPKTKFIPKTFRTKKINKNISLIYGQLK
jgi:hypothetical protein